MFRPVISRMLGKHNEVAVSKNLMQKTHQKQSENREIIILLLISDASIRINYEIMQKFRCKKAKIK